MKRNYGFRMVGYAPSIDQTHCAHRADLNIKTDKIPFETVTHWYSIKFKEQ